MWGGVCVCVCGGGGGKVLPAWPLYFAGENKTFFYSGLGSIYFNIYIIFISNSFVDKIFISTMLCGHLFRPISPSLFFHKNIYPPPPSKLWTDFQRVVRTNLLIFSCTNLA